MPRRSSAALQQLDGEVPGMLMFCPSCCERTSCVTLNMASWMFDPKHSKINHNASDDESNVSGSSSSSRSSSSGTNITRKRSSENRFIKVNECQICKTEFPACYNFETMDSITAFDYTLMTAIIAMLLNTTDRSYSDREFNHGDALLVQNLLRRYSSNLTQFTEQEILDHGKFLNHTSVSLNKCFYPSLVQKLSNVQQYIVLEAVKGTSPDGSFQRRKAAGVFLEKRSSSSSMSSSAKEETTTAGATTIPILFDPTEAVDLAMDAVQGAVDEWHMLVHQGYQDLMDVTVDPFNMCGSTQGHQHVRSSSTGQ